MSRACGVLSTVPHADEVEISRGNRARRGPFCHGRTARGQSPRVAAGLCDARVKSFEALFGGPPDVVSAAPGRVNLLGEHTDYNEGYVLPTSIPQRTRVAMRAARGARSTVYSANLEQTAQ